MNEYEAGAENVSSGLPAGYVNEFERQRALRCEDTRAELRGAAEEILEIARDKEQPTVLRLRAYGLARYFIKDADGAGSSASRHRDRSTGHVEAE